MPRHPFTPSFHDASAYVCVIGDRLARSNVDVKRDRRRVGRTNLDMVRTRLEIQVMKRAVEVVHDPHVVAIREHLRVARLAADPDAAVRMPGHGRQIARRRGWVVTWIP